MRTYYRVLALTTGSLQHCDTTWQREVLYCGMDRDEARIAYYRSEPGDFDLSYGNPARRTILQVITDGGEDDPRDDEIVEVTP